MELEKGRKNTEVVEEAVPMKHLARRANFTYQMRPRFQKGGTLYENNRSITYSFGTLFTQHFRPRLYQWSLPDGAKVRLGKGKVNEVQYSPDGTRLAVASSIGVGSMMPTQVPRSVC